MTMPAVLRRADASDVPYDVPVRSCPLQIVEQVSHCRVIPPDAISGAVSTYLHGCTFSSGDWKTRALDRIERLMTLRSNWDSYGSRTVNAAAAHRSLNILEFIMESSPTAPEPEIVPTTTGGIHLEWDLGHCEFSIEVQPSGRIIASHLDVKTGAEFEGSLEDLPFEPSEILLRR